MPILRCTKKECNEPAVYTVKLGLKAEGRDTLAEVFATIHACSPEHKATEEDLRKFFANNWERLATGFERLNQPRPILEKSEISWVPTEEYVAFTLEQLAEDRRNRIQMRDQ